MTRLAIILQQSRPWRIRSGRVEYRPTVWKLSAASKLQSSSKEARPSIKSKVQTVRRECKFRPIRCREEAATWIQKVLPKLTVRKILKRKKSCLPHPGPCAHHKLGDQLTTAGERLSLVTEPER